jgi:hypothetical protein
MPAQTDSIDHSHPPTAAETTSVRCGGGARNQLSAGMTTVAGFRAAGSHALCATFDVCAGRGGPCEVFALATQRAGERLEIVRALEAERVEPWQRAVLDELDE